MWSPSISKELMPKYFTIANFGHPLPKSWLLPWKKKRMPIAKIFYNCQSWAPTFLILAKTLTWTADSLSIQIPEQLVRISCVCFDTPPYNCNITNKGEGYFWNPPPLRNAWHFYWHHILISQPWTPNIDTPESIWSVPGKGWRCVRHCQPTHSTAC